MAIEAFGYWHLPILLGIIATAAGMETAIAHPYEPLGPAMALALAGGVALFLAGDVLFRRSLEISGSRWRGVAAGLILATIPLGVSAPAVAQLIAVVALLGACVVAEARAAPAPARPGGD
jgi:low temperature requirement protein LtrA